MTDTFKGIVTADGKKRQLPYGSILDIPKSDPSLTVEGGFADAAVVGKKNKKTDEAIASLKGEKINKPEEGDNNKIARAKNGEVEWVDVGQPTDEQTTEAVTKWLDKHPEYTTTVVDNSIEETKFKLAVRKKKANYYNSISEMKTDIFLINGMTAITLGYYEKNDGGGATYFIRQKRVDDEIDNGFIHEIRNNLVAELLYENNEINVKQLGAKGNANYFNGSTYFKDENGYIPSQDDTLFLQKAISTGKKVFFPVGKYMITSEIIINKDKCNITGASNEKTIIIQHNKTSNAIRIKNASEITISNIAIKGEYIYTPTPEENNENSNGILLDSVTSSNFKNLNISGFWGDGIVIKSKSYILTFYDCYVHRNAHCGIVAGTYSNDSAISMGTSTFYNCKMYMNGYAGLISTSNIVSFIGGYCEGNKIGVVFLATDTATGNTTFINFDIENNKQYAILFDEMADCKKISPIINIRFYGGQLLGGDDGVCKFALPHFDSIGTIDFHTIINKSINSKSNYFTSDKRIEVKVIGLGSRIIAEHKYPTNVFFKQIISDASLKEDVPMPLSMLHGKFDFSNSKNCPILEIKGGECLIVGNDGAAMSVPMISFIAKKSNGEVAKPASFFAKNRSIENLNFPNYNSGWYTLRIDEVNGRIKISDDNAVSTDIIIIKNISDEPVFLEDFRYTSTYDYI
nr:MAG TPA: Pectate lyase [Caudoviricetes sp.]